jgi:hypothetical protein
VIRIPHPATSAPYIPRASPAPEASGHHRRATHLAPESLALAHEALDLAPEPRELLRVAPLAVALGGQGVREGRRVAVGNWVRGTALGSTGGGWGHSDS